MDIYLQTANPIVEQVLKGYNGTIFAYGQTGTGKTYTMAGSNSAPELRGIIPNSFAHIFSHIAMAKDDEKFLVCVTYLEIYNEEVRDLLGNNPHQSLEVKERPDIGVFVKDLTGYVVHNADELEKIMAVGNKNRHIGATAMNIESSRSHAIFSITVENSKRGADGKMHVKMGKLHLVDLAGSERQSKTQATGTRLKEATKINQSLSVLGNVISALVDGKSTHIPYRNSKLTRLLQDSLGGNSKTVMIATIGPADSNYVETISTLRYANRAKNIENKTHVNSEPGDALLTRFQQEIDQLKKQLEENTNEIEEEEEIEVSEEELSDETLTDPELDILDPEEKKMRRKMRREEKEKINREKAHQARKVLEEKKAELQRTKKQQEELKEKLQRLESKVLVGGENLLDKAEAQRRLLEHAARELELRELNERRLREDLLKKETSSMNEVCGVCWAQAQDLSLRVTEGQQERLQQIVLPNIRRAADTARHCVFQECTEAERNLVPEETRREVLIRYQYFIPRGARICSLHREEANYENLYTAEYSLNNFTSAHIEDIIFILMEGLQNISYENIQNYPDNQVDYFIGLSKQQHAQILEATPRLRNMNRGSFALTVLLCKLRTGDSGDRLSCLFQVPRRTLETLMSVARNILLMDFVPQYLGFSHLRREQVAARNSYIADHIFSEPDAPAAQKPAITIADATYIYTQKSSNYLFQKDTYSLHKHRNLLKPFILCASDGYIIDVRGPYSATTNDATIMNDLLNETEFNDFYKENDVFILDRGFRDCMDSLHEKGYIGHMPESKEDGKSQLSTLEANKSRCVTINRWIVEAVNGRFKRDFKIFRHEYFNCGCRHLMTDFKIAAALLNAFTPPFADNIHA
ncbi:unnamed protein product [Euphydryas editha]|uniref:Kinesin-like protein n=2 Tax=Nymphalidae TaxID=33415 RepID=A0AAU9UR31_EUPED|nr:unnamed protein product [Euphydryas editha]